MKCNPKAVPMLLLFGALVSGPAMAQHAGHGYGHGVRFGITLGVPLYGPGYHPGPYYRAYAYRGPAYTYPGPAYAYPGPVYAYRAPAVAPSGAYVEQAVPRAAPAPARPPEGDWYYCADSKSYYPHVRECAAGWQRVSSSPPR